MAGVDVLLVSHCLSLGSLQLSLLHFQEVFHADFASMLSSFGQNICMYVKSCHSGSGKDCDAGIHEKASSQDLIPRMTDSFA